MFVVDQLLVPGKSKLFLTQTSLISLSDFCQSRSQLSQRRKPWQQQRPRNRLQLVCAVGTRQGKISQRVLRLAISCSVIVLLDYLCIIGSRLQ